MHKNTRPKRRVAPTTFVNACNISSDDSSDELSIENKKELLISSSESENSGSYVNSDDSSSGDFGGSCDSPVENYSSNESNESEKYDNTEESDEPVKVLKKSVKSTAKVESKVVGKNTGKIDEKKKNTGEPKKSVISKNNTNSKDTNNTKKTREFVLIKDRIVSVNKSPLISEKITEFNYTSQSPVQAARKISAEIFKCIENTKRAGNASYIFSINEESTSKTFTYSYVITTEDGEVLHTTKAVPKSNEKILKDKVEKSDVKTESVVINPTFEGPVPKQKRVITKKSIPTKTKMPILS